jgi:hypothetical protein
VNTPASGSRATPKSISESRSIAPATRKRLLGLTSRWTTPAACATASASAAWRSTRAAAVDQELQRHVLAAHHVARLEHRPHAAPPRAPGEPVAPGDQVGQQPPRQPRRVGQRGRRAPGPIGQAAQQPRAHGRQEVLPREGLDEVVVGALVHPAPHLPQVDARAQEDEGHVGRRRRPAQLLEGREAVHHGHAYVAEHQRRRRRQRQRDARGAVVRRHRREALLFQHLTDRAAAVGVVVDHEHARAARTVVVARPVAHAGTVP